MKIFLYTLLPVLLISCNYLEKKTTDPKNQIEQKNAQQIGQYVVEIFQDSKGNIWFGTLEKGVAKYDGTKLVYLTTKDGLPSNRIVDMVEDSIGNLWFGTGSGISKFDGKTFTNYSEEQGLCSNLLSDLFIDSKGKFWIGTWGGICTFDGNKFEPFSFPYTNVKTPINPDTKDWITLITEDSKGNIWIGRDGFGASKFNGYTIISFTTKEGLNSNNVQSIVEDKEGNIWIGTRVAEKDNLDANNRFGKGGLNKLDGNNIVHFPETDGLSENDVYAIYKDKSNNLWFSTTNNGLYEYKNNKFINYKIPVPILDILKDKKGIVWLGSAGGVYKIDQDDNVINITTYGPWQ